MTEKQQRFCDEYLSDPNATQAAIKAGYSEKTAYAQGCRLLKNVEITEYIKQWKIELRQRLQSEFIFDALTARKVMYAILTNEESSDKDRIAVARDFLDRAGFKPMDKVEHSGEVNNPFAGLTTAELRRLAGVADDE